MKKSRFLTKGDVGNGIHVTISNCEQMNVAKEGAEPEMRWVLNLMETDKPFVMNSTNAQVIAAYSGRTNTDNWAGVKTVIFHDPNVTYGGRMCGGLRVRAPRTANAGQPVGRPATTTTAPATAVPGESSTDAGADDSVPF